MAYTNMTGNYQSSKYIVDSDGSTPFSTIQSAINQAVLDGVVSPVVIEVRPGTYLEDLVLVTDISLSGCSQAMSNITNAPIAPVMVIGTHTPPNTGQIAFSNLFLIGNTDVLLSAVAGTCNIGFENCVFNCNGFAANLTNWAGNIIFNNCSELPSIANGIVNNTGGASVDIINSQLGAGSTSMSVSGPTRISFSKIFCPMTFNGAAGAVEIDNSLVDGTIFVLPGTLSCLINNTYITSGAGAAINTSAPIAVILNNVVINSSATTAPYVIDTTGTGLVSIGEVVFVDEATVNPSVTVGHASTVQTGGLVVDGPMSAPLVYGSPVGGTNQMMVVDNTGLVGSAAIPGGGVTWHFIAGGTLLAPNRGYYNVSTAMSPSAFSLPYSCPAGAVIYIQGTAVGASGWTINQIAGQSIQFGAVSTTVGVTGGLATTDANNGIQLLCVVADTTFQVIGSIGNITVF